MDKKELIERTGLPRSEVVRLLTTRADRLDRRILRPGNEKLSTRILTFGLPAIESCPGRSMLCEKACYACKHHYHQPNVKKPRLENLVLANRPDFAELLHRDLARNDQRVVRPHDSGDFFNEDYTKAWLSVCSRNQDRKFFLFTRSWRVDAIRPYLAMMSRLANVRVWYSIDKETTFPGHVPDEVRLAYMQVAADDVPARPVDLVFRDYKVRDNPSKRVRGALVCPYENGVTNAAKKIDCYTCGLCWGETGTVKDPRRHHEEKVSGTGRWSLSVVA